MHDPLEGISTVGTITTGASRVRIPAVFEPAVDAAVSAVRNVDHDSSLYLYGSVATGMARPPASDVDLLTIGVAPEMATEISDELSGRFAYLSRAVEVATAQPEDFEGETDAAFGGRVFLRHYCVHLAGPDPRLALPDFAADVRAVRGFNGDLVQHVERWREELDGGGDPVRLGRRLARKTLLAVAGLVSIHDETWTTDRASAAARWGDIEPALAASLDTLLAWSRGRSTADRPAVAAALDGVVAHIAASFAESIGLWDS